MATGFWPLAAEAVYGEFGWHELVEYGYSEDGVGHEAGAYHRSIFGAMNRFAEFAQDQGVNLYTARFKRVFDGSLLLGEKGVSYEAAYRVYRDPAYLGVLAAQRRRPSEAMALRGITGLADAARIPVVSELMSSTGYIFLRHGTAADSAEIRLNYIKTFDRGEADRFTTFFYRNGQQVDGTAGRIIYSSPRAEWMYATAAHNTIVVDGRNQRDVDGRLVAFNPDPESPIAVVASDPEALLYEGVRQVRGIALIGDGFVVFDHVRASGRRMIDRYQHGRNGARLGLPTPTVVEGLPFLPEAGDFERVEGGSAGREVSVTFGNQLKMRLVSDRDFQVYKALTVGGWQAEPREVTFARVTDTAEVMFLAGFSFGADKTPPKLRIVRSDPDDMLLVVEFGGKIHRIAVSEVNGTAVVTPEATE